jgi:hypothetical protein
MFDVITHSRGALVLRTLIERGDTLPGRERFALGHGVLVAAPNEGTPLATPARWNETVGWIANLLDMFPPNPVSSNAAMIAHWITWFVKHGIDAADGLASMDMRGEQIRTLQGPPKPTADALSALVSNFEPDSRVLARAVDLGFNSFFEVANDLVVPTSGGWRIDQLTNVIPPARVGCFGRGGNIGGSAPTHVGFFSEPASASFVSASLSASDGSPRHSAICS